MELVGQGDTSLVTTKKCVVFGNRATLNLKVRMRKCVDLRRRLNKRHTPPVHSAQLNLTKWKRKRVQF